ncbi:MAG TPA: M3 family metallopeptidase [Fibrobacteria bacterium]|nr:M3 family metallopeptidase [Fibrobacteria bacterium]
MIAKAAKTPVNPLLQELNQTYLKAHFEKEDAFWKDKMALAARVPGDFEKKEIRLQSWISDPGYLPALRAELAKPGLSPDDRIGLQGWLRFFEVHAMENPEAKALANRIVEMEGRLQEARQAMKLGYVDPATGAFTPASSIRLGLFVRTSKDEALRKAAHRGLQSIEREMLANGFLEIVRERNRLGRMLGYEDYYDYKVTRNEGFPKRVLFDILGDLEKRTRDACKSSVDALAAASGPAGREAWNFLYLTAGDVTAQMDPYFGFGTALGRWGRSFTALGIKYRGATLTLDLLDRKGKYENGFMHGPVPGFVDAGEYLPARINFTANAIPGQVGSGHRATETLFHEGGHAAHFSNILMPAPCFSQEYAPTSVAFAETQSMFLDSFIETPEWLVRYARDERGLPMPLDLIRENIVKKQPYKAFALRAMLTVCFAEKAIYEMPEAELTPDNVIAALRRIEKDLQFLNEGTRPVLSVPHLLSGESSAYYHGYVLAEMAVHQTRRFFLKRDGVLVDNPNIGRDLAEHYWKPGNARTFPDMIQGLTGQPFGAEATVEMVNKPLAEALAEVDQAAARNAAPASVAAPVDLDAVIRIVHGDEVIASNENGESFDSIERRFSEWLLKNAG